MTYVKPVFSCIAISRNL